MHPLLFLVSLFALGTACSPASTPNDSVRSADTPDDPGTEDSAVDTGQEEGGEAIIDPGPGAVNLTPKQSVDTGGAPSNLVPSEGHYTYGSMTLNGCGDDLSLREMYGYTAGFEITMTATNSFDLEYAGVSLIPTCSLDLDGVFTCTEVSSHINLEFLGYGSTGLYYSFTTSGNVRTSETIEGVHVFSLWCEGTTANCDAVALEFTRFDLPCEGVIDWTGAWDH